MAASAAELDAFLGTPQRATDSELDSFLGAPTLTSDHELDAFLESPTAPPAPDTPAAAPAMTPTSGTLPPPGPGRRWLRRLRSRIRPWPTRRYFPRAARSAIKIRPRRSAASGTPLPPPRRARR